MCDATRTVGGLRAELSDRPESGQAAGWELDRLLSELASRELIDISPGPGHHKSPPLLRAGFTGFPEDFDPGANALVALLARRVVPWVVDPRSEQADILFIGTFTPPDGDALGRQATALRVVMDAGGERRFEGDANVYVGTRAPLGDAEEFLCADPEGWLAAGRRERSKGADGGRLLGLILGDRRGTAPRSAGSGDGRPKLAVGMATYDDYDGVYFTVQALRMFHPEVADEIEILVIDNNPRSSSGKALQQLSNWVPNLRYKPCGEFNGTAVRDYVFRHARAETVLCIDSHVLIEPGGLRKLIDFVDANPGCRDLLQGPMVYDDLRTVSTHCDPVWRGGMFGTWGCDPRGLDRDAAPFEIPLQGLGLFACRRDAWPGFHPAFRGFGGEEGYIHEKFRQAGGRTLCLPFLRWLHRFGRPDGQQYPNLWDDRMRNYLLGSEELGLDSRPVEDHFESHVGPHLVDHVRKSWLVERDNPFRFFDAIYCINLDRQTDRWEKVSQRFAALGIDRHIRRFSAVDSGDDHHLGCLLSHRAVIDFARRAEFEQVLVFEDDVIFHDACLHFLRRALAELSNVSWRAFYLGGAKWGEDYPKLPDCLYLEQPRQGPTCTHAVAYHRSSYDFLLQSLPASVDAAREWLAENKAIDQALAVMDGRVMMSPVVATQESLLQYEDPLLRRRFTI